MKHFFHNLLIAACTLLCAASSAFAAADDLITVSGVVLDNKKEPVTGAVVMLQGSPTVYAVTDIDGKYTLKVPREKAVLDFNCMNFKMQSIPVNGRSRIDVVLEEDAQMLDEIVVVGYGAMRRSDLTGSVASVKVEEEDAARSTSLDQLLSGRVSGVQVLNNGASPDGGVSIRVRGLSSFNGSTEPLYVVDGVIINGASTAAGGFTQGGGDAGTAEETNGLNGINPQDIASMEILKDASATAIYGSQGANGVVLITTKAAKQEKMTVKFNAGVTVSNVNKRIDMLQFDDFVDFLSASGAQSALNRIYDKETGNLKVTPVDWQDYSFRTAVGQRYYFAIAGRPEAVRYMFSVGYNNTQGAVRNTGFEQYTMRLSLDKQLSRKITVGTKINLGYSVSQLSQGANSSKVTAQGSWMRSILTYQPYSEYNIFEEDEDDENISAGPDRWLKYFTSTKKELRVTPNMYFQWDITPWLSFKTIAGGDWRSTRFDRFKGEQISRLVGSLANSTGIDFLNWNWDNMLLVNKSFSGGHHLSGTLGMTMSGNYRHTVYNEGWWLDQDGARTEAISNAQPLYSTFTYSETSYRILSFYLRAIYSWKDRYVLTATVRADGSSRFQGANKWGVFPSFAFAWRLNEEHWFNVPVISQMKLRVGWGLVGNQNMSSYATIPTYSSTRVADHTVTNDSHSQIGVYLGGIANPKLRWETTDQVNAGIDMGFFKGRLAFSVDFYNKLTRDLLQQKQIARSSGFTTMWVNQGTIRNRGVEFSFNAVPVKTREFEWTLGGNLSVNRNRITAIGEDIQRGEIYLSPGNKREVNYFWGGTLRASTSSIAILNIFIEGQPLGQFYGLKSAGIVQEGEDWPGFGDGAKAVPGDVKYLDLNGNGCIDDDDRTLIGDPNPDFTFGFNTSFTWKGLTLAADFNGAYGNDIYNNNLSQDLATNVATSATRVHNIRSDAFRNAWSSFNRGGKAPRLGYSEDQNYITDRYVEDGSYLRLANLSLSYRIPLKKKKNAFLKGLSVGASCGNVFVATAYSGWDPEVNSFGADIRRMGVDVGSYPNTRSFTGDIKFTF